MTLDEILPPTIEDAITVVECLGLNYLWIDRYCINQQNDEEKLVQLPKMNQIYEASEVTIVAAAGSDPSYGLPGVSTRKRKSRQISGKVGNYELRSTLNDPCEAMETSVWNMRGWTYQEALLSRRCLVFTENQIYFECLGMHCFESLNTPLKALHKGKLQHFNA
jgi:hypothetical protein